MNQVRTWPASAVRVACALVWAAASVPGAGAAGARPDTAAVAGGQGQAAALEPAGACEPVDCPGGKSQSPIRIAETRASSLARPRFGYRGAGVVLRNTGHSLQVDYAAGDPPDPQADNLLFLDGAAFRLVQFHFHRPAEHLWGDVRPDMELHLVHRDANGGLAVVALPLMQKAGAPDHPGLAPLWADLPGDGERRYLPELYDSSVLTASAAGRSSFRYPGSLTTAPCTEDVRWSVFALEAALVISPAQYERYVRTFPHPYCRPVQPLNGRVPLRIAP